MSHYRLIIKAEYYGRAVHHVCTRVLPYGDDEIPVTTDQLDEHTWLCQFDTDRPDIVRRLTEWFGDDVLTIVGGYRMGSLLWWDTDNPHVVGPFPHDPEVEREPDEPLYYTDQAERLDDECTTDPRV